MADTHEMGLSAFYGKPKPDDEAVATVKHAIDIGCSHVDSADVYGPRTNERMLAKVMAIPEYREKTLLTTKYGAYQHEEGKFTGPGNAKPEYMRQMLKDSIERLGCTPDLYYLHRPDPDVPIEETVKAMDEERKAGKFKYIGLSEMGAETLERAAKTVKIDAIQVEFSPWSTDIEHNGIAEVAKKHDIAIVCYSPLGRGFLTGRYKSIDDFEEGDFRRNNPRFQGDNFQNNLKIVRDLEEVAKRHNATAGQIVLAWILQRGYYVIPGSTNPKNIDENAAAAKIQLSADDVAEIDKIVKAADIAGERYDQAGMDRIGH